MLLPALIVLAIYACIGVRSTFKPAIPTLEEKIEKMNNR